MTKVGAVLDRVKPSALGTKILDLGHSSSKVRGDKKEKNKAKDEYKRVLETLEPVIKKGMVELGWSVPEHSGFTSAVAGARKQAAQPEWPEARDGITRAATIRTDADRNATLRQKALQDIQKLQPKLGNLDPSKSETDDLRSRISQFNREVPTVTDAGSLAGKVKGFEEEIGKLAKLHVGKEGSKEVQKLRLELMRQFTEEKDKMAFRLAGEATTLAQATDPDKVVRQDDIKGALLPTGKAVQAALNASDQPDQLKTILETQLAALRDGNDAVKTSLASFAKDRSPEEKLPEDVEKERKAYATAEGAIDTALLMLREAETPLFDDLQKEFETLKNGVVKTKAGYQTATVAAGKLQQKVAATQKRVTEDAALKNKQFEEESKLLKKLIEGKKKEKTTTDSLKAALDKLAGELDKLGVLLASNNKAAFEGAAELRRRIEALVKGEGEDGVAVKEFTRLIAESLAIAAEKPVLAEFATDCGLLKNGVADLQKRFDPCEPAAFIKEATKLKTEADKLKANTAAILEWRDGVKLRLKTLEGAIKDIREELKKKPGANVKGLAQYEIDCKTIADTYKNVGIDIAELGTKLASAEAAALSIGMGLKNKTDGTQVATGMALFAEGVKKAEAAELDAKKLKERNDGLEKWVEAFTKKVKETSSLVKKAEHGDTEELEAIKSLRDELKKLVDGKDFDSIARRQQKCQERLDKLHDNPEGSGIDRVSQLPEVQKYWETAFNGMQDDLASIVTKAKEAVVAGGLDARTADPIEKGFAAFAKRFDAKILVQNTRALSDKKADAATKKKAREEVLKEVRTFRALLANDPLVAKVNGNPFGVPRPFSKMTAFLDTLEFNVLRGVKA